MPGPTNIKPSVPGMHGMGKVEEGPLFLSGTNRMNSHQNGKT